MIFLILTIPILWLLLSKYRLHNTITAAEVIFGVVLITSSAAALYTYGVYSQSLDKELWNGQVTSKSREVVACAHSYDCACDSEGSCSTCYEHSYDVDWVLDTTAGRIYINRIDSQGLGTPSNWARAYVSEPVSIVKNYTNYIQAAPSSLFYVERADDDRFGHLIPEYPLDIRNEYSYNHVRAIGLEVEQLKKWNTMLAEALKVLGPSKEVNVIVLIVNTDVPEYLHALEKAWLKGNKNDVVVILGSRRYPDIDWVGIMSWSPSELFKVQLRDEIKSIGIIAADAIVPVIQQHVAKSFQRLHMQDFSLLKRRLSHLYI